MRRITAATVFCLAACGPALAQSTAPAPGSGESIPEKTAPGSATVPDTDVSKKAGSLSEKLNSTNGVIHPEGSVDPSMQKPAPETGTMPVIPAPGSPGGPTGVQPK